jgi:hypothetical protein
MPKKNTRPQTLNHGSGVTTPAAATMIALLGPGLQHEGNLLSRSEHQALAKVYGFVAEKPSKKPAKPVLAPSEGKTQFEIEDEYQRQVANWERWEDPRPLLQAGASRNLVREAAHDGFRLVAWIAKYVEPGQDPLKTLIQMACDAGFDVDPADVDFAVGVEDEEATG